MLDNCFQSSCPTKYTQLRFNYPFGFGPYRLSPGLPSCAINIKSQMPPMSGIKPIKTHQPLLPISCNLLTETANPGRSTARPYNKPITVIPNTLSKIDATTAKITLNNTNIQNSVLLALPLKSAYCFKTFKYQFIKITFKINPTLKDFQLLSVF